MHSHYILEHPIDPTLQASPCANMAFPLSVETVLDLDIWAEIYWINHIIEEDMKPFTSSMGAVLAEVLQF